MKRLKLGKILLLLFLPTFAITNESCKKSDAGDSDGKGQGNALPHTRQYSAEVATEWFRLLSEITRTKPYFSPHVLRIFAYSGVALYESVVPGMPSYQSIYKHLTSNTIEFDKKKDYYWPASANAAIARISFKIMQNYPTPDPTRLQALEDSFNTIYSTKVTPEQLQHSNEFGRYVADVIYEWSKTDGTLNPDGTIAACPPFVSPGKPGSWVPTPPGFLPVAGACQGNLRTFIPNLVNTVLAPAHPPYSTDPSSAFYQAANETYEARNNITDDQTKQFNNWRDFAPNSHPLAHMVLITTNIIAKEKSNLEDAATIYAKQTMAASDAIGTVTHSKFHYFLMRPVTYIRNVMGHSNWSSLPNTPQLPSYPDESAATASSIAILEKYFGANYAFVDDIHKTTHGTWSYNSFKQMMDAIVQARVSGGTIFRFAGDAGVVQGRKVGEMIDQLPFKKP